MASAREARSGNGSVQLTIPGITNGAIETGSGSYLAGNGSKVANFGGAIALINNGAATTVTITVTCLSGAETTASSGTLLFSAAPTIIGTYGTSATGTYTAAGFRLF